MEFFKKKCILFINLISYQYRGPNGEKFTYTNFLLLVQCFANLLFAYIGLLFTPKSTTKPISSIKKGRAVIIHKGVKEYFFIYIK